ncbi:hypothetical protein JQ596_23750 [Bradyrhizobium manausense]|uniref:hypothetical protein n=1 Tax=Bradyrhizobium manausense TaxID=989370 RepID=UPI001BAC67B2|nr:hypothetical protein [Bradyrhizobium manausense]MBR0828554.1 hypothetical protein [Bradyrhizobium manausense]
MKTRPFESVVQCDVEGRERIERFVPRHMTFPIGHYDPNKTLEIARAPENINGLFTRV